MSMAPLWALAVAAAASISLGLGARQTLGLFMLPLAAEDGVSPIWLGAALAFQNLFWGLAQPVSGAIADRHGAGRVMAGGAVLLAVGFALPAMLPHPATILIGIGVLTGMGIACTGTGTALAAVGRAATPERRAELTGLVMAGGSLGQAGMVPMAQGLISELGATVALGILATIVLLIVPISRAVEWRGPGRFRAANPSVGLAGLPCLARRALAERDYALLTAGFFACGFQLGFLTAHLPTHLTLCGLPAGVGGLALMTIGIFNIPGSWICGRISNLIRPEHALGAIYMLRSAAILVFVSLPPTPTGTLVFAAVMGFVWLGPIPLISAAIAQRFGTANLGALYGICYVSHQLGSFLGAGAGALLLDMTGSYAAFWSVMIAVGAAASVATWQVREPARATA